VLQKLVEEGTLIPAGTAALAQGTTIVTLADVSEMYVMANVDEVDVAPIKVGMPAEITLDALPNKTLRGKVVKIFPKGIKTQNVVQFPVRVKVLDLLPQLRPEMTADVTIVVAEKKNCLQVPDAAIDRSEGRTRVQVLPSPNAEPVEREVKVGVTNWDQTEILSGLKEGEVVVLPAGASVPFAQANDQTRTAARTVRMMMHSGGRRR